MTIRSGGTLVRKSPTVLWEGTTATYGASLALGNRWSSYSEIYRRQLWVAVVVNKRAGMISRLPLPVYRRDPGGRTRLSAAEHPYAALLARPHPMLDPVTFWTWITSTWDIFGEAFLLKIRDPGGRPTALVPLHPTSMTLEEDGTWTFQAPKVRLTGVKAHDLVHFQTYHPDGMTRGLSRLEPLRDTLENEDAARRATSSFWRRGARPGFALSHERNLSQPAQDRLKVQMDNLHGGADKVGSTLILEEGMKALPLTISNDEAQYIETRRLNREEVVAAYDMPPPAVQILDRATFSNITEQFRSIYRDTAAPILGYFEAVLEHQLRGSVIPGRVDPDFGADVYAEFLLDEVLRGSFEARAAAYKSADYMTVAEKRERENLPHLDGTDVILVNTASQPLDSLTAEPPAALAMIPTTASRAVLDRVRRTASLDDVDATALVDGLNGDGPAVLALLAQTRSDGGDLAEFRSRLSALTAKEAP